MKLKILTVASHRNGISGAPFHAVLFRDKEEPTRTKLGVVFEEAWYTAVFDIGKLAENNIAFGSNSWRGDCFEPHLRKAINTHIET